LNHIPCGNDPSYDEESKRTFGDQAAQVCELLKKRTDMSQEDLAPLTRDPRGLSKLIELAAERPDLALSDLIVKAHDGRVRVSWALKDDYAMEVMEKRKDIKPQELARLKSAFINAIDDDLSVTRDLFEQASDLLVKYGAMTPDELTALCMGVAGQADFISSASSPGDALQRDGKLEIMRSALSLLDAIEYLKPNSVAKLIRSAFEVLGDLHDSLSLRRVALALSQISKLLEARKNVPINQVRSHLSWMQQIVPDNEPESLENRAALLSSACSLLKERPNMDFDTATLLLIRITERVDAPRAEALLNEFSGAIAKLIKGYDLDEVAAPLTARQPRENGGEEGNL